MFTTRSLLAKVSLPRTRSTIALLTKCTSCKIQGVHIANNNIVYFSSAHNKEHFINVFQRPSWRNRSSYSFHSLMLLVAAFIANYDGDNVIKKKRLLNSILRSSASGDVYGLKLALTEMQKHKRQFVDEVLNSTHEFGWTPLMAAAVNGNVEIVFNLLKAGANPNFSDKFTTSREVSHRMRIHELEVRREREKNFSEELNPYTNFLGFTPLHYAVISDSLPCVKALLDHGADTLLKNHLGHRASAYVSDENNKLYEILLEQEKLEEVRKKEEEIRERLKFPLEKQLKEYIIGQDGPISTVSSCIRRKQNGWYDEDHPLVFLFLGSSGVGKTELAKQVANYLHKGDKKAFIRLDMSEYQEKHEVAKLIGAPPGYIGHDEGGQLTKKLRAKPDAVVLFDEVDKAHPDVLTVLLQLFDEGRLTDGRGQTINCKNAIFVMTSNLASDEIAQYGSVLRTEAANARENKLNDTGDKKKVPIPEQYFSVSRNFKDKVVQPILKRHFGRDEFLGRINEFVYFLPFSDEELIKLVERELKMWRGIASKRHKVKVTWESSSIPTILADGYNIYYGARSIKYEVDRRVASLLASSHERGILKNGCDVHISTSLANNELAQSSDLSSAPIHLEISSSGSNPVIVSEKDLRTWHQSTSHAT